MRAAVWHGRRDVQIDTVPDPSIVHPTDAIVRVTSNGLCGSDLHLYEVLAPFMTPGDILGHEPMGVVEAVGSAVTNLKVGDRVVVPFNISCGQCLMCDQGLQSQCETTQVREQGCGAALFGYTKLYGQVPGGQAELLRVPHADYGPVVVPEGPADDRYLFLSDVLPTAWQAVQYASIPPGGSVAVLGLGPMMTMFDKQIQLRMGQANVRRWIDDILPLLTDDDVLGVDTFATHHVPLSAAPEAYEMFQRKADGAIKVVFRP